MLANFHNSVFKRFRYRHISKVSQTITVRSIRMAFNEYRPPKPINKSEVIIMHGIMASKKYWHKFAQDLAKETQRTIFCVDARNHGGSEFTKEHSSKHIADDVAEFIKDHSLDKISILGHGMGGRAMMMFALTYPSFVDRAIIVDISPVAIPKDFLSMDQIFIIMKGIEIPSKFSLEEARQMMYHLFKKIVSIEKNAKFLANSLQQNSKGELYWSNNIDVLKENLRTFAQFMNTLAKNIKPFEGPTMFVCGNRSNFIDTDSIAAIKILFPKCELHWLDASHLMQMDQPEEFLNLVVHFLNK